MILMKLREWLDRDKRKQRAFRKARWKLVQKEHEHIRQEMKKIGKHL